MIQLTNADASGAILAAADWAAWAAADRIESQL